MTKNEIYELVVAVKKDLANGVCMAEAMYDVKKTLHKNWKEGVALATVLFMGYFGERCSFMLPKTSECVRNYRKVEKMLKKGKPLHQTVEKNGEVVEASFTPSGVKFGRKRRTYRIMAQTITILPETEEFEEYWDEDPYWTQASLPVLQDGTVVSKKLPAFGCPKFFTHKKDALRAAQKWVENELYRATHEELDPEADWSYQSAFKSVDWLEDDLSRAVYSCISAFSMHSPEKDVRLDITVFECDDDSRMLWRG